MFLTELIEHLVPRLAHRAGVTYATSSLLKNTLFGGPTNLFGGLAVTFRTGAAHALESGAIIKPVTALHISITRPAPYRPVAPAVSVGTQISVLRRLLLEGVDENTETGHWFKKAAEVRGCRVCGVFLCLNASARVPFLSSSRSPVRTLWHHFYS